MITTLQKADAPSPVSAASLLFTPGERPDAAAVAELSRGCREFSISFNPTESGGVTELLSVEAPGTPPADWLELLANGLTFDLTGLKPGAPSTTPAKRHCYGLPPQMATEEFEAITLLPGPHLAGGEAMLPIVRSLAWLTGRLAGLPGVRAVAWHPAGCWSAPEQFRSSVQSWTDGGPFPMFSLAGLVSAPDGGFLSDGLALFTGQELSLREAEVGQATRQPKAALRLAHWLVEHGRLTQPQTVTGPDGDVLRLTPSPDHRLVNVEKS